MCSTEYHHYGVWVMCPCFTSLFICVCAITTHTHNFSTTEALHTRGGEHGWGFEGVGWGGEREEGVTFPFTGCQSIKAQSTAVRADRQHRKEQGPAMEPPLHSHHSSPGRLWTLCDLFQSLLTNFHSLALQLALKAQIQVEHFILDFEKFNYADEKTDISAA